MKSHREPPPVRPTPLPVVQLGGHVRGRRVLLDGGVHGPVGQRPADTDTGHGRACERQDAGHTRAEWRGSAGGVSPSMRGAPAQVGVGGAGEGHALALVELRRRGHLQRLAHHLRRDTRCAVSLIPCGRCVARPAAVTRNDLSGLTARLSASHLEGGVRVERVIGVHEPVAERRVVLEDKARLIFDAIGDFERFREAICGSVQRRRKEADERMKQTRRIWDGVRRD